MKMHDEQRARLCDGLRITNNDAIENRDSLFDYRYHQIVSVCIAITV